MKVLFLCGSPRKKGNTANILNRIASRLTESYETEICYITDYHVNGCMGCNACQQVLDAPGCVQKDDMAGLLNKIISADAVIYATPLYGHSFSGQLKILMDRHVALFKFLSGHDKSVDEMEIFSFIKDKPVALVVSCQGPRENNTELVQMQFDKFCESSLSRCFGKYIFPWCSPEVSDTAFPSGEIERIAKDIMQL